MTSPMSICQVFESFCFELRGFDTDDTSEEENCQCLICYTCQLISRLSDTYIKYKSE